MSSECEIAWAAGLFEGEGNFAFHTVTYSNHNRVRAQILMRLAMCDLDVVKKFHQIVGVGTVIERNQKTVVGKTVWTWAIGGIEDVVETFSLFEPWLGQRRKARFYEVFEEYCRIQAERDILSAQIKKERPISMICSRCKGPKEKQKQSWCLACHREYARNKSRQEREGS